MKYDFRGCGIGDFIGNPEGLTLQDYSGSHRIFAEVFIYDKQSRQIISLRMSKECLNYLPEILMGSHFVAEKVIKKCLTNV